MVTSCQYRHFRPDMYKNNHQPKIHMVTSCQYRHFCPDMYNNHQPKIHIIDKKLVQLHIQSISCLWQKHADSLLFPPKPVQTANWNVTNIDDVLGLKDDERGKNEEHDKKKTEKKKKKLLNLILSQKKAKCNTIAVVRMHEITFNHTTIACKNKVSSHANTHTHTHTHIYI